MSEETTLQKKVRERRERLAAEAAASGSGSTPARGMAAVDPAYSDLVPDADAGDAYERSEADLTIDRLIKNLDIVHAYQKYVPHKTIPPFSASRREGIMVRCPRPDHTDNNPSAWLNRESNLWYCGGCGEGGDAMDLASFYFGKGDYKTGKSFGELRKLIAESLGYKVVEAPGVTNPPVVPVAAPEPAPEPAPAPPLPPTPVASASSSTPAPVDSVESEPIATVTSIFGDDVEGDDDINLPTLDWHPLVTPGTFLDTYMQQTIIDDVPEEYHFWNGLLALSMAIGRDVVLDDTIPVLGNLFMCIIGRTSSGKSRSLRHLKQLITMALPYDPADPEDRGAKPINTPGSAESLINQFSKPIYDTSGAKPIVIGYAPVRGVVEFSEMSALLGRAGRTGSVLKPTLMDFFDGDRRITTASLTSGSQIAEDAFASVFTSVQPRALPKLVDQGDADSGFLNRWIFVSGTPKKRVAIGGARIDLAPCMSPLQRIHEWARPTSPGSALIIPWSEQAASEFTRLFDERIEPLESHDDTGLFGRVSLLCKKLCLLLSANEMLDEVTAEIVEKVKQIFEYIISIWNVQAENLGNTDEKMCEERIIQLLMKKGPEQKDGSLAIGYIVKIVGKKYPRKLIEECLRRLTSLHEIDSYVPPTPKIGRPPSPRYRLVSEYK